MILLLSTMIGGFAALCCSLPRHARDAIPWVQVIPGTIMGLRISGWLALLIAIILAIKIYGVTPGLVWFFGLLPLVVALLAALLVLKPRLIPCMLALPLLAAPGKILPMLLFQ